MCYLHNKYILDNRDLVFQMTSDNQNMEFLEIDTDSINRRNNIETLQGIHYLCYIKFMSYIKIKFFIFINKCYIYMFTYRFIYFCRKE